MPKSPRRRERKSPLRERYSEETTKRHIHSYKNKDDVGTGVWWLSETLAYKANTIERVANYAYVINTISEQFVCLECREHFKEFIEKNPIESYIVDSEGKFIPDGAFKWAIEAHNNANHLTGKPIIPYIFARDFFKRQFEGEGCTDCSFNVRSSEIKEEPEMKREMKKEIKQRKKLQPEIEDKIKISYTSY